jgi:hypothetical protein
MKLESIRLQHAGLGESWVQKLIAEDPSILGLGELVLKDKERPQPSAGRLDLLLQNPDTLKRYEVEIQLGPTDETHIIRTIEYWDIERKRYPQYKHAAVIVAEEITSRFFNVIQLFNGAIPLIALKMTAYKIGDDYSLTFVTVLNEMSYGLVGGDEPVSEVADRPFWEKQSTKEILQQTDRLLELVKEVEPNAVLNYTRSYIGLKVNNSPMNFVSFVPRRRHVIMHIRLPQSAETDKRIEHAEFDALPYDDYWREYRLRVVSLPDDNQRELLHELFQRAHSNYRQST